jgi:hypothetical protein
VRQQFPPEGAMDDLKPDWLDLETNIPIESKDEKKRTVVKITSLSRDTIERRYGHLINRPSEGRCSMKMRHALAIANGTID